jgi:hypothetical protein
MIYSNDQQFRHVYLGVLHSADPKPSSYGESVGHYEGDTSNLCGEQPAALLRRFEHQEEFNSYPAARLLAVE